MRKIGVKLQDMMALNRSPESFSPQNEFYLLCSYCAKGPTWLSGKVFDS